MKRLALIGSKEFAEQISEFVAITNEYEVVGYFDDFEKKGSLVRGLPVFGKISEAECCYSNKLFDYLFFAAGYNNFGFRDSTFSSIKGKIPFANIIMPDVEIGKDVRLGEGIFIGNHSIIGNNTIIEDNVFLHGSSNIGHDNVIGKSTYISGRFDTAGFCEIGRRNFMGIKVMLSDHVSTCDDVWVGLGCIVAKDIKQPGKYMSPSVKLYKIE